MSTLNLVLVYLAVTGALTAIALLLALACHWASPEARIARLRPKSLGDDLDTGGGPAPVRCAVGPHHSTKS